MTQSAQKMIMFCIFRYVKAYKEAKNWEKMCYFLMNQKSSEK